MVTMTGDGVNDALPLSALILVLVWGITGTDVNRACCRYGSADDNFANYHAPMKRRRSTTKYS